jgi:ParB family chromosome partitioning protein
MADRLTEYDVFAIPVEEIWADSDFNCRSAFSPESCRELADSMQSSGLHCAVIVQPIGDVAELSAPVGNYQWRLLAGHRRLTAAKLLLRWPTIAANVRTGLSDRQARILNFVENLEREDLNILAEAKVIAYLFPGKTAAMISKELGRDRRWVATRLRLLTLPEPVQALAATGCLASADLDAIAQLESPESQIRAATQLGSADRKVARSARNQVRPPKELRRRSKAEISQKVRELLEMGITGLTPRFGAWCAGCIDWQDLESDIFLEIGSGKSILAAFNS